MRQRARVVAGAPDNGGLSSIPARQTLTYAVPRFGRLLSAAAGGMR